MAGIVAEIKALKKPCEANIVSCFYKNPELLYEHEKLTVDDFEFNEWKVFFSIAQDLIVREKKQILDEITIGFYLEKHSKLRAKYHEYGGYQMLESAKQYIKIENLDGYVTELNKWNTILQLIERGFPITKHFDDFKDMSLEEIHQFYEVQLNDTFIHVGNSAKIKSHNLCEGIHDLIEQCDKGLDHGLAIESPLINDVTGGNMAGNITLLGGSSGTGKTTVTLEIVLTAIINQNEQCVMVINEQDETKLRKEMLAWTVNNILGKTFNKKRLRQGGFTGDERAWLKEAADWLEAKKDDKNITIIPLQSYTVSLMKKIINKYAGLGVKYFILDTFKASDDADTDKIWLEMMNDMRKLYDTVKPSNKNVHLWCTLQLRKDKVSRYLTNDNIGLSKNVVDVCSTVLLMRAVRDDEKEDGKNELRVYRLEGKNGATKIPVTLHKDKHYMVVFIDKNREGESNSFQVVAEVNLGRNTYKEIGVAYVPQDY
jgi:replicative DNA helicase